MADPIIAERQEPPVAPSARTDRRSEIGQPRFSVGRTFAALQYPAYRLWFMGQLASLIGTWMQVTTEQVLIFQLTGNSPAFLGYAAFASGLPVWMFMLYGGTVADRVPRRTLLVITQSTMMTLAFISAALVFLRLIQPWQIIVLGFFLGIANAFDAPARQAFVLEMVDKQDMTNAIALNSTMFQAATIVGPSIAGIAYAAVGPAWCFTINGLSFIAVIAALLAMKLRPLPPRTRRSAWKETVEGVRYTLSHPIIRTLIATIGIGSLFGLSFVTLFPDWAIKVLGGDASTNGFLNSARGVGAMSAALMIASLGRFRSKGKLLTAGLFVLPIALILFSFTRNLLASLLVLVGAGWAFMVLANMANTLVQVEVSDELRGRVMAVYSFVFFGLMPIGGLGAGLAAEYFTAPVAVLIGGIGTLVFAITLFLFFPRVRALE